MRTGTATGTQEHRRQRRQDENEPTTSKGNYSNLRDLNTRGLLGKQTKTGSGPRGR